MVTILDIKQKFSNRSTSVKFNFLLAKMSNKVVSVLVLIASIFLLHVKGGELDDYRSVIKNLNTLELIEGLSKFDSGTKCGASLNQYLSGLGQIKLWALQSKLFIQSVKQSRQCS